MHKIHLMIAILAEVTATTALKASESFTRPGPSLVVVLGYATAFYCLSLCLSGMSIGTAYAIWSGMGTVLITLIGAIAYKQALDPPAVVGVALIVLGVLVLNGYSQTVVVR